MRYNDGVRETNLNRVGLLHINAVDDVIRRIFSRDARHESHIFGCDISVHEDCVSHTCTKGSRLDVSSVRMKIERKPIKTLKRTDSSHRERKWRK